MPLRRAGQRSPPPANGSRPRKRRRSLWQRLSGTTWGALALMAVALLLLYVAVPAIFPTLYSDIRQRLLEAFGYALAPSGLWVLVFVATLRWRPRLLLRWWRTFLGSALLLAALMGALSFVDAPTSSSMARHSLGGDLGLRVRGDLPLVGIFRVALFAALGLWVAAPRRAPWATGLVVTWAGRLGRLSWAALLLPYRAIAALVRLYRRYPVHRGIAWAFAGLAQGARAGRRGAPTPPERPVAPAEARPAARGRLPAPEAAPAPTAAPPHTAAPPPAPGKWRLPPISLLNRGHASPTKSSETEATARLIEATLRQYGVEVSVTQVKPGPTVTRFGLTPGWVRRQREVRERDKWGNAVRDAYGRPAVRQVEERSRVKVDMILAREKDLSLALAVPSLRIEAPVPGESVVGVEVPNRSPSLVTLRSTIESGAFSAILEKEGFPLALGQSTGGEAVAVDMLQMPHLLIAGATGSGKSVCMNALITSMITRWTPQELRLVLVDPKRVELTPYNGIPHLATPVIVDTEKVVRILKGTVQEMTRRYKVLEAAGARNVQGYNRSPQAEGPMPYLVVCIDELADLMMVSPYDAEHTLCRLAQLGRAVGIHLIVATQRPSVDVVTGLIKANFPTRVSFAVVSQIDSRTILDSAGAERLLGKGDMLFQTSDMPKPKRVQGAFVSDEEVQRLVAFWRTQEGPNPASLSLEELGQEVAEEKPEERDLRGQSDDELLEKALELAQRYEHLSTSLLQRKLQIGYPRAAKLMDMLEEEGVVGPQTPGGRPRDVLHRPTSGVGEGGEVEEVGEEKQ